MKEVVQHFYTYIPIYSPANKRSLCTASLIITCYIKQHTTRASNFTLTTPKLVCFDLTTKTSSNYDNIASIQQMSRSRVRVPSCHAIRTQTQKGKNPPHRLLHVIKNFTVIIVLSLFPSCHFLIFSLSDTRNEHITFLNLGDGYMT